MLPTLMKGAKDNTYVVPAVNRRLAERGIVLKWFDSAGILGCKVYNHEVYNY